MKKIIDVITGKEELSIRIILFFAFLGHGLVSLHVSEGYKIHYTIFSAVNIFDFNVERSLSVIGIVDMMWAFIFLLNIKLKYVAPLAILYLMAVGISGGIFFMKQTGQMFGIAELFKRFPWMFCALFLWLICINKQKHHYLIRLGIAFAFIGHGLASLDFLGLRAGQLELASKIVTVNTASQFVYYCGVTDLILGAMLISGFLSRWAAIIGSFWLAFIVSLSFMVGIPEGIFRTGFFLMCIYVSMDKRCHNWEYQIIR